MHPLTALDLAIQHHHEIRAAAARSRLAADARRLRRSAPTPSPPKEREGALAERLAAFGPGTLTIELHRFARDARRSGACPLLLSVLVDPAHPDVARLRAFGRIMADLHRPTTEIDTAQSDAA